ncbi:hypothetical protein ACFY4C_41040 [Actinomadura viridis]
MTAPNCPKCGRPTEWNGTINDASGRVLNVWCCSSGHTHTTT